MAFYKTMGPAISWPQSHDLLCMLLHKTVGKMCGSKAENGNYIQKESDDEKSSGVS